jgi:hypothetical protein
MTHQPDDLAPLLTPTPGDPAGSARRAELLRLSTRVLRRGVWLRRAAAAAGIAAVFAAGGVGGWALKPPPPPRVVLVAAPADPPQVEDPPVEPSPSAGELELKAELSDDRAEVARLYKQAGDAYLTVERDYAQAARCYRLHLNAADPDAKKVAAADSWLLMTMKETPQ